MRVEEGHEDQGGHRPREAQQRDQGQRRVPQLVVLHPRRPEEEEEADNELRAFFLIIYYYLLRGKLLRLFIPAKTK